MRSPAPRVQAAIAAAIGGGCGLLLLIGDRALRTSGDVAPGAWIVILIGAFLSWWAWLFWRALKAERSTRIVAAAGFIPLALLIFAMQTSNIDRARRFRQEGLSTEGIVTGVFPHDHNHIGYCYVVDGVSYQGRDFAPGSAEDYQVGDSIEVHFLRSAPSSSASRYPGETTRSALFGSLFGAWWLIAGCVIVRFHLNPRLNRLNPRLNRFLPPWMTRKESNGRT